MIDVTDSREGPRKFATSTISVGPTIPVQEGQHPDDQADGWSPPSDLD